MTDTDEQMMQNFMSEMEKAQENWLKVQEEIDQLAFQGYSDEKYICVILSGKFKVVSVTIDPVFLKENADNSAACSLAVAAAFDDAISKAERYFQQQIEDATEAEVETSEGDVSDSGSNLKPRLPAAQPEMKS